MGTYQVLPTGSEPYNQCIFLGFYLYLSKKNGCLIKSLSGPDPALAKILIQLFSDLSEIYKGNSILPLSRQYRVRQRVSLVFYGSLRGSAWLLKNIIEFIAY